MPITPTCSSNNLIVGRMPCTTVTINSGFAQFLDFLKSRGDQRVVAAAKHCLDHLRTYAENELPNMLEAQGQSEFKRSGKTIGDWAPVGMVGLVLDRFFRYHLLRELITTPKMRGYTANAVFHCLRWLGEQNQITDKEWAQITETSDRLVMLGEQSHKAAIDLAESVNDDRALVMITKLIELARHDVTKIQGTKVWLEVWAPVELPTERNIGPVEIPLTVAKVLEPGWMIECALGLKKNGKWEILESGSIYPSLPFH